MAKEFSYDFYHSKEWQKTRDLVIQKRHGLCERCLAKGIIKTGNTVHHKIELTPENINDPRISLGLDNLQLLCRDCHADVHRKWKGSDRYELDEWGNVVYQD